MSRDERTDLLWIRNFRWRLERTLDRNLIKAAEWAAHALRCSAGTVSLQAFVEDGAAMERADTEKVIIYLATLGLAYLAAGVERE